MSSYSCLPCDKSFNGEIPYKAHLASSKHVKKMYQLSRTDSIGGALSSIPNNKQLDGGISYETHSKSPNHKENINQFPTTVDSRINVSSSSADEAEPYIISCGKEYRCTLCKLDLNSIDQVRSHIRGRKHMKLKTSESIKHAKELHSRIPQLKISNSVSETDINDSTYSFSFRGKQIENALQDVKVFNVNDPIFF